MARGLPERRFHPCRIRSADNVESQEAIKVGQRVGSPSTALPDRPFFFPLLAPQRPHPPLRVLSQDNSPQALYILLTSQRHLRPGGWIEFGDIQPILYPTTTPPPFLGRFFTLLTETFSPRYSWNPHVIADLPSLLSSQGFTSISTRREKLPLGMCAGGNRREREAGLYMQYILEGLAAGVLARGRELGVDEEEARALAEGVASELRDPSVGGYLWWSSVWAQRPV